MSQFEYQPVIAQVSMQITSIMTDTFTVDPLTWFTNQAQQHNFRYLLAHADDGLIWGTFKDQWLISGDFFSEASPPLRAITLQQARLFGPEAELLLWRNDIGWQARLAADGAGEAVEYFDEPQILWGNKRLPQSTETFTLVTDGEQGHLHAVPVQTTAEQFTHKETPYRPLRLHLRHYLTEDDQSGQLKISLSRLTNLTVEDAR